jgi:hypothetical protein
MKRVIVAIFALLVTVFTVNAQVFIGGGLGLSFGNGKSSGSSHESSASSFGFSISPQVGYYLNNNWAIGVSGSFGNSWSNNKSTVSDGLTNDLEYKYFSNKWGVNVFGRYKLTRLVIEKLSLFVEGSIGVQGSNNKQTENEIITKYPGSTVYSINARPVFSYKLLNKLDVLAYCNFLTIGYSYQTLSRTDINQKSKNHNFNLGFNSFSDLNIGFIYKF